MCIQNAFISLSFLLVIISCGTVPNESTMLPNTQPNEVDRYIEAADFRLTTMNGAGFRLSDYEGQVVVLNIWATWCMPCRKEIPAFMELQDELRDDGVQFLGVSIDEEGWHAVRPFAEEYNINYPLVVDDGIIQQKYGPFQGIPTTFIINKKREIEYVAPGAVAKETLRPILQELADR